MNYSQAFSAMVRVTDDKDNVTVNDVTVTVSENWQYTYGKLLKTNFLLAIYFWKYCYFGVINMVAYNETAHCFKVSQIENAYRKMNV